MTALLGGGGLAGRGARGARARPGAARVLARCVRREAAGLALAGAAPVLALALAGMAVAGAGRGLGDVADGDPDPGSRAGRGRSRVFAAQDGAAHVAFSVSAFTGGLLVEARARAARSRPRLCSAPWRPKRLVSRLGRARPTPAQVIVHGVPSRARRGTGRGRESSAWRSSSSRPANTGPRPDAEGERLPPSSNVGCATVTAARLLDVFEPASAKSSVRSPRGEPTRPRFIRAWVECATAPRRAQRPLPPA